MELNWLDELNISSERKKELEPRVQELTDIVLVKENLGERIRSSAELLAEIMKEPHKRLSRLFISLSKFFPSIPEEQGIHCQLMYSLNSLLDFKTIALKKEKTSDRNHKEQPNYSGYVGILHDIGKSALSPKLVQRIESGTYLDRENFELMKLHVITGYMIIATAAEILDEPKGMPNFRKLAVDVVCTHEEIGGFGYFGLRGEEIPFISRVTALADSLLAISRKRGYDPATPPEEAYQELSRCAGLPFDKDLLMECNRRKLDGFRSEPYYQERLVQMIQRNTKYGAMFPREFSISYNDVPLLGVPELEDIYLEIRTRSEKQFDPDIVRIFISYTSKNPDAVKKLIERKAEELNIP